MDRWGVRDEDARQLLGGVTNGPYYEMKKNAQGRVLEPDKLLRGGPQMVEVSRDGKRVYFTNSLYSAWDEQFYPAGVGSWMVKLDAAPEGGIAFDTKFFMQSDDYRVHQIRLEGGDSSSDSFCYP